MTKVPFRRSIQGYVCTWTELYQQVELDSEWMIQIALKTQMK